MNIDQNRILEIVGELFVTSRLMEERIIQSNNKIEQLEKANKALSEQLKKEVEKNATGKIEGDGK